MAQGSNVPGVPATTARRWLRLSIRLKMLILLAVVSLTAVGTLLYLATSLFTRDKLAYVYDLNAALVMSLAEQTRLELELLRREGQLHARELRSQKSAEPPEFWDQGDIVRVEVWSGVGPGDSFAGRRSRENGPLLEEMGLARRDLEHARRERPLPLTAIATLVGQVHVQNSSLPPEAALLTLAFPGESGEVIAVDVRHQRLLRIFGGSGLHEAYLVDQRGEVLAHAQASEVISHRARSEDPLVRAALAAPVAHGVTEVHGDNGDVFLGAYRRVDLGRVWVLAQIPRDVALQANRELVKRAVLFAVAVLLAGFILSVFFSRLLAAPIQKLRAATEVIGQGHFDVDLDVTSGDEIGDLARAFARMAQTLKETQAQLIQSEKLAAFGQLGAGITHEVKNPMTGIVGFAQLAQRKLDDPQKTGELLKMIEREGLRCRDILVNFLKFARAGQGEREPLDVNRLVEDTAAILRHQLAVNRVRLELDLAQPAAMVSGAAPELQQVLMNLALNAQQAMPEGGLLRVSARAEGEEAVLRVTDTGVGIPPEIRSKIFEPFFTTKPKGEGTGLGLSVSFGIIRSHLGSVQVESAVGSGTTFEIRLPRLHQDATSLAATA